MIEYLSVFDFTKDEVDKVSVLVILFPSGFSDQAANFTLIAWSRHSYPTLTCSYL